VQQKLAAELEATGCYVDCFAASDLALQYVQNTRSVDVVLTSLEIEPMPGLELCWSLRTLVGEKRPLHIIVMSSNTSERALAEALDCGADDFTVKPIRREELTARLRAANRIIKLQRDLITQAQTDYLTGVLNRRAFVAAMEEKRLELDASDAFAICLLDIDRFKSVNDTHGHDVGDVVIREIARIAGEEAPIVARFGGEEFALGFPLQDAAQAAHWCNVIRETVGAHEFQGVSGAFHATCSLGVSAWQQGESLSVALRRADQALMTAKHLGRNQVRLAASQASLEIA
jgi:diguanylate cyclase (GGDEF)-like protein